MQWNDCVKTVLIAIPQTDFLNIKYEVHMALISIHPLIGYNMLMEESHLTRRLQQCSESAMMANSFLLEKVNWKKRGN